MKELVVDIKLKYRNLKERDPYFYVF
jgi:hypothetical protein